MRESNTDARFMSGDQSFVNNYFGFNGANSTQQFYFNLIQQPINMITGYQRQHRKSITYIATDGADPSTTDQYTRLITHLCNKEGLNEVFSKACELSAISGLCLLQPYLDYASDDPAQGVLKMKVWEYNSFMVDSYARQPDFSDAQFVWCQEYISKREAIDRFPGDADRIQGMSTSPQLYGQFYFLPEAHNLVRNELLIISYVWYKWKRTKEMLYSKQRNQFFDMAQDAAVDEIMQSIPDLEVVKMEVPTWKLVTTLNDQMMFQGDNPLHYDECPLIPIFWNYDPHLSEPTLRNRSLVRPQRDSQFLFNYKVMTNNDIAQATINAGWKRKIGAVANEENLKRAGQGWDVIINDGYELMDCEKIIPSSVPESDLALAQQMADLTMKVTGIDMENWAGQQDKQVSSLTMMLKQAANLLVFQKYFDQWDHALKLVGDRLLSIVLNNWNESKVSMILNEEPSAHFYSKVFAKYHTLVEEGLNTPTQRNMQAQALLDINQAFGREVFPPSMIIKDMNIQGRGEAVEFLKNQEMQAGEMQKAQTDLEHVLTQAKLKESYSKSVSNMATASERQARKESNIGLYEERISEITRNDSLSLKDRMEALSKLMETIKLHGELETMLGNESINQLDNQQQVKEDIAKRDAKQTAASNEFLNALMGQMSGQEQQPQQGMNNGI